MADDLPQVGFPLDAPAGQPGGPWNAGGRGFAGRPDIGEVALEKREQMNRDRSGPHAARTRHHAKRTRALRFLAKAFQLARTLPAFQGAMAFLEHAGSRASPYGKRARRAQFNSIDKAPSLMGKDSPAFLYCASRRRPAPPRGWQTVPAGKGYAPEDMPDICQDIDFNQAGADLKAECGVQTRNYMAYRNIPEHRNLLLPKGAKIVQKGNGLELRLTNTLPIGLPEDMDGKILFDEKLRRTFVKNRMDYCEFFPEHAADRMRILRLDIPLDAGGRGSVCFTVGTPRPRPSARRVMPAAWNIWIARTSKN